MIVWMEGRSTTAWCGGGPTVMVVFPVDPAWEAYPTSFSSNSKDVLSQYYFNR